MINFERAFSNDLPYPERCGKVEDGYYLRTAESIRLQPNQVKTVPTGWKIEDDDIVNINCEYSPDEDLKDKFNIDVVSVVIHRDSRHHILVIIINNGDEEAIIGKGSKIAHMILKRCVNKEYILVDD